MGLKTINIPMVQKPVLQFQTHLLPASVLHKYMKLVQQTMVEAWRECGKHPNTEQLILSGGVAHEGGDV